MDTKTWLRRGKSGAPTVRVAMAIAGLYAQGSDPLGEMRRDAGDHFESLFHGFPLTPIRPIILQYDFTNAYKVNATNVWNATAVGTGTVLTAQAGRGGFAKFVNGASDNDAYDYQAKYAQATLAAAKGTWFITEVMIKTVAKADIFVGLCAPIASGNIFDNRLNSIGFYTDSGGVAPGVLWCETTLAGVLTRQNTGVTLADGVKVELGFCVVGVTSVFFFVNNVYKKVSSSNMPIVDLAVSFGCRNGEAAANEMTIYPIQVGMDR